MKTVFLDIGISVLSCKVLAREPFFVDGYEPNRQIFLADDGHYAQLPDWAQRILPHWQEQLRSGLSAIWSDPRRTDPKWRRGLSPAEIASLTMMALQPGDRVVLVSSDTLAGQFCAAMLHHCLATGPAGDASGFRPDGLEVPEVVVLPEDGSQFMAEGLPRYMQLVEAERSRMTAADKLCFNITGGRKGIIPFAVLAAQFLGGEVVYLPEAPGSSLISLSPLPENWEQMKALYG